MTMTLTIGSYIESVSNCNGRFRTLKKAYPVIDSDGNPVFAAGGRIVTFRLEYNGTKYLLRCPLAVSDREKILAEKYALQIRHMNNPFIAYCDYLPGELLAYGPKGKSVWTDVIIEKEPDGEPLRAFIRSRLMLSDRQPFRDLLIKISAMAAGFHREGLIHGNLRYENIIVDGNGSPVALGYPMSHDKNEESDTAGFAALAMNTYIAACEPSIYAGIHGKSLLLPEVLDRNVTHIQTQAQFLRNKPMETIAEIILKGGSDRIKLNRALTALSETPFVPLPLLTGLMAGGEGEDSAVSVGSQDNYVPVAALRKDTTFSIDFRKCDFTAPAADTMVRFRIGTKWDFADRYGNRITNSGFLEASDFYEGRAVVTTENGMGMIDRRGNFVLGPGFETVEWYGKENIASACADGKWELYNRRGKQLTVGGYDWMGECSEGTFLARRGNKFGYLNSDGTNLTDMRFDDAYSFRGGTATVKIGMETYRIDGNGHKRG